MMCVVVVGVIFFFVILFCFFVASVGVCFNDFIGVFFFNVLSDMRIGIDIDMSFVFFVVFVDVGL